MFLNLGPKHISEHIAISLTGIAKAGQLVLQSAALGIAREVGLDADPRSHIVDEAAATAKDVEAGELGDAGVNVDKREAHGDFELRVVLRYCSHGDQERKCDNNNPFLHVLPLLIKLLNLLRSFPQSLRPKHFRTSVAPKLGDGAEQLAYRHDKPDSAATVTNSHDKRLFPATFCHV